MFCHTHTGYAAAATISTRSGVYRPVEVHDELATVVMPQPSDRERPSCSPLSSHATVSTGSEATTCTAATGTITGAGAAASGGARLGAWASRSRLTVW